MNSIAYLKFRKNGKLERGIMKERMKIEEINVFIEDKRHINQVHSYPKRGREVGM